MMLLISRLLAAVLVVVVVFDRIASASYQQTPDLGHRKCGVGADVVAVVVGDASLLVG